MSETLRARALIDIGRYDEAAAVLAVRLATDPQDADALVLLATAHYQSGNHSAALEAASASAAIIPDNEWPHRLRALSLAALGRGAEARQVAEHAVELAPNSAVVHIAQATVLSRLGEHAAAYEPARRAVELAPNNADAHVLLGQVALANSDKQTARTAVAKALELDPANATALHVMGAIDLGAGKLRRSAQLLLSAVRVNPRATSVVAALDAVGVSMTNRLLRRLLIAMTVAAVVLSSLVLTPEWLGIDDALVPRLVVGLVLVATMVALVVFSVRAAPVELRSTVVTAFRRIPVPGRVLVSCALLLIVMLVLLPAQSARLPAIVAVPLLALILLGSFGKRLPRLVGALVLAIVFWGIKLIIVLPGLSHPAPTPPVPVVSFPSVPGLATGVAGTWTERLCTQLEPLGLLSGDGPPLLPPFTPDAEVNKAAHDYLVKQVVKRDTVLATVRAMDAPPVADGQAVRASLLDALQADRDAIAQLLPMADTHGNDATTRFSVVRKQGFDKVLAVVTSSPEMGEVLRSSLYCTAVR